MEAINITAYINDNSQIEAIKAVLKALKIKFDVAKEKPYNLEFVAKIKKAQVEIQQGKTTNVQQKDFKEFLGL